MLNLVLTDPHFARLTSVREHRLARRRWFEYASRPVGAAASTSLAPPLAKGAAPCSPSASAASKTSP